MLIAWVCVHGRGRQCDHRPVPCQVAELRKLFGPDIQIRWMPSIWTDPEYIVRDLKIVKPDEVVLVAPLTMMDSITRLGLHPLQSLVEDVPAHEGDWTVGSVGKKFLGFRRVDGVTINGQDL